MDHLDAQDKKWDDVRLVVHGRVKHWHWTGRWFATDIVPGTVSIITLPGLVGLQVSKPPVHGLTIELERAEVKRLVRALGEWLLKRPDE